MCKIQHTAWNINNNTLNTTPTRATTPYSEITGGYPLYKYNIAKLHGSFEVKMFHTYELKDKSCCVFGQFWDIFVFFVKNSMKYWYYSNTPPCSEISVGHPIYKYNLE